MKKYDLDDDFIEDLDDEEEELYEEDILTVVPDQKLLIGLVGLGVVIVIVLVVLFVVFLNGSRKERESVEAQLGLWEEIPEEELQEENSLDEDSRAESSDVSDAEDLLVASPSPSVEPVAEAQEEVAVGALDDAQDPQSGGAAGNESAGAEVTVVPLGKDETQQLTMGIDVSKYQGTIDWVKVKASGVEFAMIRVGYRAKSTGEIFEDPTARYNMQEAQAAGINWELISFPLP